MSNLPLACVIRVLTLFLTSERTADLANLKRRDTRTASAAGPRGPRSREEKTLRELREQARKPGAGAPEVA